MERRAIVLLAVLATGAGVPASGQTRGFSGAATGPAPRAARPAAPLPTTTRFPETVPPLRSQVVPIPRPVTASPPPHTRLPFRLPWFGLVYFDPYWYWESRAIADAPLSVEASDDGRPIGGLQLDVEPRRAMVYVDGRFAGLVEQFSGYYRHMDIPAGLHRIELVAADFDPLVADVSVSPGRTTTYRASLTRLR